MRSSLVHERLLEAKYEFYAACTSGPYALDRFARKWEALAEEIQQGWLPGPDSSELTDARTIAQEVKFVAEGLADLEERSNKATVDYLGEVLSILSLETELSTTGDARTASSLPQYIACACDWLLQNLHDPYPTRSIKQAFAKEAELTSRTVDDWFKNVRRSIGWVVWCKKWFDGKRKLAVAAATRLLKGDDENPAVPDEIAQEFHAVKASLEEFITCGHERETTRLARLAGSQRKRTSSARSPSSDRFSSEPLSFQTSSLSSFCSLSVLSTPSLCAPSLVHGSSDSEEDEFLPEPHLSHLLVRRGTQRSRERPQAGAAKRKRTTVNLVDFGQSIRATNSRAQFDELYELGTDSAGFLIAPLFDFTTPLHFDSIAWKATELFVGLPTPQPTPAPSRKRRLSDASEFIPSKRVRTILPISSQPRVVSGPKTLDAPTDCLAELEKLARSFDPHKTPPLSSVDLGSSSSEFDVVTPNFGVLPTSSASSDDLNSVVLQPRSLAQSKDGPSSATAGPLDFPDLVHILASDQLQQEIQQALTEFQSPEAGSSVSSLQAVSCGASQPLSEEEHNGHQASVPTINTGCVTSVLSEVQWERLFQLLAAGQEAEALQSSPFNQSDEPSCNALVASTPADATYEIVQGPVFLDLVKKQDTTPFALEFEDIFNFSPELEAVALPIVDGDNARAILTAS